MQSSCPSRNMPELFVVHGFSDKINAAGLPPSATCRVEFNWSHFRGGRNPGTSQSYLLCSPEAEGYLRDVSSSLKLKYLIGLQHWHLNSEEPLFPHGSRKASSRQLSSKYQTVEPCGHQLLFTFDNFYLRLLFALHGQIVTCDLKTFQDIRTNNHLLVKTTISWQLALIFSELDVVILCVDHNRLSQCYFILRSSAP
jgi:hypothetical protein